MRIIESVIVDDGVLTASGEASPMSRAGNYESVRFNAMTHGVLSKLVVLAHEDHAEFDDLLAALINEHQPAGITERHLIEELAIIIWRKRRVLLAEGARINQNLQGVANQNETVVSAASPFHRGVPEVTDLSDVMGATPAQLAENQQYVDLDLAGTNKAGAILRKGGKMAYEKARRALVSDSRDWWDSLVAEEKYPPTVVGLKRFIQETLSIYCHARVREAQYAPAIKAQIMGEGLQANKLESLNRYETHLDRKFERTLAMLLKLTELRGGTRKVN